jgi:sensor c-di-GMP phosphodiesterase-like protein
MAKLSNQLYPCFNGKAKSDTVIVHGKPDTSYLKGDTTIIIRHDTVFKTIRLASQNVIIPVTTTIHDTIADNRALASCTMQLRIKADSVVTLKANLFDKEKSLNVWRWIAIGLISVLGVYTAIKGYLLVSGGGVVNTAGDILKKL